MKRLLFTILLFTAALPAAAQLYHPGEQLFYRVSYKAKMFPNTEVGAVEVKTSEVNLGGPAVGQQPVHQDWCRIRFPAV